jgi:eukaryotic-like serine/threonine-protein kinase
MMLERRKPGRWRSLRSLVESPRKAMTWKRGTVLAGRYEIIHLLGRGGMGAVYKARDTELDRVVALKLIRPELATNPAILTRFKQELILARQVTHRNVIRIFDLGQSDGIKFITMDFVEGQNLHALLLERGKFQPEQAGRVMLQICRALEAAHGEGVIHRDLKPQNIMVTSEGRVYVMDFGIARSAYLPGMTQTGALIIGTPEYMSPEQARGEILTERSDLFSLGVIFYELLTAKSPYPADAPLGTLWKRLQEKPKPPIEVDASVPKPLNEIVMSALEIEPEKRLSSASEMARQLEIWLGPSAGSSTIILPAPRIGTYWKWASAGLAIMLVTAVMAFRFKGPPKPKAVHPPVSVLVADFTNHTGDPIFDDTLEPMFNVALEGASFINAFNRGNARKLARELPHPTDKLDEQPARLVAVSQGIGAVAPANLAGATTNTAFRQQHWTRQAAMLSPSRKPPLGIKTRSFLLSQSWPLPSAKHWATPPPSPCSSTLPEERLPRPRWRPYTNMASG